MELTHKNNFGLFRLLFAYGVIVSHSAEMLDGNRAREVLTRLGSQVTMGGLAVDGFFLISGYLIASSFIRHPRLGDYLASRILRIYPAFIAASLICLFLVGPLGGGVLARFGLDRLAEGCGRVHPASPAPSARRLPVPAISGARRFDVDHRL